jgi:hypothetical protein
VESRSLWYSIAPAVCPGGMCGFVVRGRFRDMAIGVRLEMMSLVCPPSFDGGGARASLEANIPPICR